MPEPAAVVEHRSVPASPTARSHLLHRQVVGLAVGAECEPDWIEDERVVDRRDKPRRHDQIRSPIGIRVELRLRESHPVLFLDFADGERRRLGDEPV